MSRPAKLQINQRGAWRDALRFDFDALTDKSLFLDAAAEMARSTGQTGTTMRIVTDASHPEQLMAWDAESGWTKAAAGASSKHGATS